METLAYQSHSISYQDDGWFNAAQAAAKFDRRVDVWLKTNGKATESQKPSEFLSSQGIQAFVAALDAENIGKAENPTSVKSVRGGKSPGTYAVELVAIRYAAWINPAFEIRVYRTFQQVTKGNTDWRKLRHATASTTKMANHLLKLVRESNGKDTESHH